MDDFDGTALVQGYATIFVIGQIVALALIALLLVVGEWTALFGRARHRRAFHCSHAGREVDVEFADLRLFGWRRPTHVVCCSAFDPASAITCRRACLASAFRQKRPVFGDG